MVSGSDTDASYIHGTIMLGWCGEPSWVGSSTMGIYVSIQDKVKVVRVRKTVRDPSIRETSRSVLGQGENGDDLKAGGRSGHYRGNDLQNSLWGMRALLVWVCGHGWRVAEGFFILAFDCLSGGLLTGVLSILDKEAEGGHIPVPMVVVFKPRRTPRITDSVRTYNQKHRAVTILRSVELAWVVYLQNTIGRRISPGSDPYMVGLVALMGSLDVVVAGGANFARSTFLVPDWALQDPPGRSYVWALNSIVQTRM